MLRMSRKEDDRVLLTHKWNSEKKGNKHFERGERKYGQQWQGGENKEKEEEKDIENMCGHFQLWLHSFSTFNNVQGDFQQPTLFSTKMKKANEANRGSFIWRISWKSSSIGPWSLCFNQIV